MNDLSQFGVEALSLDESTERFGGLPGTGCPGCDGYPFPSPWPFPGPSPWPSPWPSPDILQAA